jgi:hypothetical protein
LLYDHNAAQADAAESGSTEVDRIHSAQLLGSSRAVTSSHRQARGNTRFPTSGFTLFELSLQSSFPSPVPLRVPLPVPLEILSRRSCEFRFRLSDGSCHSLLLEDCSASSSRLTLARPAPPASLAGCCARSSLGLRAHRQPDKPTLRLGTLSCLQHFFSVLLNQRFAIDPCSPSFPILRSGK